ncbi:hypothetical protein G4D82_12335 [Flavobacterium sp. CYK-4]|uniref:hypothetical protein n=1 Tax=Flavobacterium lotistagni TaxID=2709660 RepID=UPI0014072A23|nr:hypothetical protein [Flavobacterium lotistagni]NHM08014.1 hypothetical protein [Flavobacterium lotistagni]
MKFWNETLRPKGRYELKRCLAVMGFNATLIYVFIPVFVPEFDVKEFVVFSLLSFSAACIGIALQEKIKVSEQPQYPYGNTDTYNPIPQNDGN